jgi:hypothetical protein
MGVVAEGAACHHLEAADSLEFGEPADSCFRNGSALHCIYAVILMIDRRAAPRA